MINIKEEISKIDFFNTFFIVNDRFLVLKKSFSLNEIYYEVCNRLMDEVLIDDNYLEDLYQSIANKMDDTYKYYFDLQNKIEDMLYPSKDYYNLIINISKIYHLLDFGRFFLDMWKDNCKGLIRKTYVIDIFSDYYDLRKIKKDYYIYKLVKIYSEKLNISFFNNIEILDYEKYLFFALVSIPVILDEGNINCSEKVISYVNHTYNLLSEEYKKYQENSQSKFEEQNNNI